MVTLPARAFQKVALKQNFQLIFSPCPGLGWTETWKEVFRQVNDLLVHQSIFIAPNSDIYRIWMHIIKIYLLVLLDCSISVFPIALFNVSYKNSS